MENVVIPSLLSFGPQVTVKYVYITEALIKSFLKEVRLNFF